VLIVLLGIATNDDDDDIQKFLLTHDDSQLQDISVEEMRHIIPKLFKYCGNHSVMSCKKGLILDQLLVILLYRMNEVLIFEALKTSYYVGCTPGTSV